MKFTAYYVIRARPELLARVERESRDELAFFAEPALWSHQEGGRTVHGPVEWTERVKLSYLLKLQTYLFDPPENPDQVHFQSTLRGLLGPEPWGEETFDRWWEVERFGGLDQSADEAMREASVESVRRLKGADSWRDWLIQQKERGGDGGSG